MDLWKVKNIDKMSEWHKVESTRGFFDRFGGSRYNFLYLTDWEYMELVENIKNGKVAVFPISTDVRMEEVINTNKLGLQVYLLQYKKWKEFKEKYIADVVEVQTDTEQEEENE